MKPKGIPKKRMDRFLVYRDMFIRRRHVKGVNKTLNAAERSVYRIMSTSLCGINPVMTESFYGGREKKKKIIMKRR